LALNILHKNIFGFFGMLENNQSAPLFFLVATKIFYLLFGTKEWVFRLLPFVFSILSIPLFYYFSKKFLDKKISIIVANFLFGLNYYLIYYFQ